MTIILEPRQTLLPLVGGLFLFAGRGLHPPGAFGYRFHVLGPEGLGAHQAAPGCGEDRSFQKATSNRLGRFIMRRTKRSGKCFGNFSSRENLSSNSDTDTPDLNGAA